MKPTNDLRSAFFTAVVAVCVLWWIKLAEIYWHLDLAPFGVVPGTFSGLQGIIFAPLIHGSIMHIFSNTLPTVILGTALLYGYPRSRWWVLGLIWIGSGLGVWLFARQATHIGASGITHGLFFFLLIASILRRDKRSVAIMMIVFFLYGSMIWGIFPREEQLSFEYHFFGAVSGAVCALLFWRQDPKPPVKRYRWEAQPDEDDPVIGDDWKMQ